MWRATLTAVRETEDLVSDLEIGAAIGPQGGDGPRELHAHGLGRLWRNWVLALPFQQVHPVESEGFDLDESLVPADGGHGDGVDVEGFGWAGASFHGCDY